MGDQVHHTVAGVLSDKLKKSALKLVEAEVVPMPHACTYVCVLTCSLVCMP